MGPIIDKRVFHREPLWAGLAFPDRLIIRLTREYLRVFKFMIRLLIALRAERLDYLKT
jgi:hypothetical protein